MSELTCAEDCAKEEGAPVQLPLWNAVLASLNGRVPADKVQTLADSALFVERRGRTLRAAIPASRLATWLREGYLYLLAAAVPTVTKGACTLSIAAIPDDASVTRCELDPAYSLDRFVASPSNQFVFAAVQLVAEFPGERYSPLFIQGPPGSGKSHLLRGIAFALQARLNLERIHCLGTAALALELVTAIQKRELSAFRARYRQCAALLLDDVEDLIGRDATQEEIVHTLDALSKERVQVVASSRHAPESISGLSGPLARRLAAGLHVRLSPPEWETRVAILMDRARAWGAELSPEVASFLVARSGTDLTQIDTLLTHALADPGCERELTNLERVRHALARAPVRNQTIPPESVIALVARRYGLRTRDFRSPVRSQRITGPRQIAIYLVRRNCGLSFPELGRLFSRHHTTALHACRATATRLERDAALRLELRDLERELFGDPASNSEAGVGA
ncbi:MAG: ATP-binding protein [Myxococcales bacterium]|nr:ATP-binding protein [Myxococcales bacterium]